MNTKLRSFVAGAVGMVVAFGIVELVHGLYEPVPSVLVAVAQRIVELTPGGFATRAVEILGKADIPVLVTVVEVSTLALAGFLAYLSLRAGFRPRSHGAHYHGGALRRQRLGPLLVGRFRTSDPGIHAER